MAPEGRVTHHDLGLWSDAQGPALAGLAEEIARFGAVPGTQLIHAGRKGSVSRPWEGYAPLVEGEGDPPGRRWRRARSPANPGWHVPDALDAQGIAEVVTCYAPPPSGRDGRLPGAEHPRGTRLSPAQLPVAAGQPPHRRLGRRLRGAHPFDDAGGRGRPRGLARRPPADGPFVLCRRSARGLDLDDSVALASRLARAGVDVVDCSSGGLGERTTTRMLRRPEGYQVPYAERIRAESDVATMAVGLITTPAYADAVVREGRADLVAIGREALQNPHWALGAARALGVDESFAHWPKPWGWWLDKRDRAARSGTSPDRPSTEGQQR